MNAKMVKARLQEVDGSGKLEFKFNPTDYSVTKGAQWKIPPRNMKDPEGGKPEFISSDPQAITVNIFFDDWESIEGDISKDVKKLFDWCTPSRSSVSAEKHQPPELLFLWGTNTQLADQKFVLERVNIKYTMFSRTGNPLRAEATINLKEVPNPSAGQNPTSGAIQSRKTHLIADGDTLQSIAYREYGNPGYWRSLATFNDLDDPMRLSNGGRILLPSPDEAAEMSK